MPRDQPHTERQGRRPGTRGRAGEGGGGEGTREGRGVPEGRRGRGGRRGGDTGGDVAEGRAR
ncbi:hypothetical protein CAC01_15010 [Streptomyces sp. CLI2509]|nr:hypothetical protein CAC01_15010 [Streptomyces sp. CLI2509]